MLQKPAQIYSVFLRKYATNLNPSKSSDKPLHPFKQILTRKHVIEHLGQNLLYKDDKIAVFNKPPDVAKSRNVNPNFTPSLIPRVFMEDILPDLAKIVPELEDITITKFPERYTSGVMILSSKEALPLIGKCQRRAKANLNQCDQYLAITQGQPILPNGSFKLAVRLAENETNKRKVPILIDEWCVADMKKQRIDIFRVKHSIISVGPMCSLVQLSISSAASNAIRLFLASKLLSPLLGDNVFSSRVRGLFGIPMPVDPWSDVGNSSKKLPTDLLNALELTSSDSNLVPPMIHLQRVFLPNYNKGKDLVLNAPIPSAFNWACQQLELPLNVKKQIT